ncbi:hypothetical protein MUG94_10355 [Arthrobacter gengyunqii]|uniref:Uncharacterized protein n=1 Tax=Arthrobacter gengyunqii TaxID=2886940 RepID=A0A9X1M489_9MICC|nr:hypothetical protein [Arthrobacter gengyunqii]MCC3271104.1 hypothetical protein [Arthrobacter gengyunqii]UOY94985.1 hypothetical protein MUG94_10355 [Arthrobacter gengyunqii]
MSVVAGAAEAGEFCAEDCADADVSAIDDEAGAAHPAKEYDQQLPDESEHSQPHASAMAALTGASAAPTQATPQAGTETEAVAPLSDDVLSVNVTCHEDKHYQWNVNYNAGAPETTYAVYADYRYETGGGFDGGGGSFSDPLASTTAAHYAGVLTTGIYGIGSSGTSTGHAGPNGTRVYVTVTVNGYTQEGWDDC